MTAIIVMLAFCGIVVNALALVGAPGPRDKPERQDSIGWPLTLVLAATGTALTVIAGFLYITGTA